jgi:class 3 adenylate cyclase
MPSNSYKIDDPLYNSSIINIFVEYIKKRRPDVDLDSILRYAGITTYQLEDQGHWFSQRQTDRFYEILSQKAGDPNISRKVGRYAASSKASGVIRQYALGLMSPISVYLLIEKVYATMSRGATVKARKLSPYKVEIVSTPNPGVDEKPYQCENRIGTFESVAKLFTDKFSRIEHPKCFHRGDDCCQYIITWKKNPSFIFKWASNYFILISIIASIILFFVLPSTPWAFFVLSLAFLNTFLVAFSKHFDKKELTKTITNQGDVAKNHLDEINIRYNNALLVQEIGQATSMALGIEKQLQSTIDAMERRLDFDRGGIWLTNDDKTLLVYKVGYGYKREIEKLLKTTYFHLDRPEAKGVVAQAFKQQKPYLVNDISEIERDLSKKSLEFIKQTGAQSFICLPIVYEGESLGVILVDNIRSKKPLTQSDMSLLMGIGPQIGVSIHNIISYQRLQESKEREQRLRELFERYVPAPIIKQYIDSAEMDIFRGHELSITALFLDIRGFTSRSKAMDPRDVVSFLNDYFERCSLVIAEQRGHINKYTGDGFFAIFGAPEVSASHTTLAFNAACKILGLSEKLFLKGKPIEVGIGLDTGTAIMGNIGSHTKIEYTAVGGTVNTAARLQELTKVIHGYPIIMSKDVWEELANHPNYHEIRNLGIQKIRGKKEKLEAFGFTTFKNHTPSRVQSDKGFIPLQRTKGV